MKAGFVGWRGMVGSVLMERMRAEGDFEGLDATFFSTSSPGKPGPTVGARTHTLVDALDLDALAAQDVVVTCQGSEFTKEVHPKLRGRGWTGYWIDAASALRMRDETILALDPVNRASIDRGLAEGVKDFCGPNCTVSLMILGVHGLFQADLVEWVSAMTYQAASGAGAQNMRELVAQMAHIADAAREELRNPGGSVLDLDRSVIQAMRSEDHPTAAFGAPLAGSVLPFIAELMESGQSREEWKAYAEGNKILERRAAPIPMDGVCVRIGAMRCHSQALVVKLRRDVPLDELRRLLSGANPWVRVIDNDPEVTCERLTPAAVTGTLAIPVGRIRKMLLGPEYVAMFTVGDQLLWGAAEPLRRMLNILREHPND